MTSRVDPSQSSLPPVSMPWKQSKQRQNILKQNRDLHCPRHWRGDSDDPALLDGVDEHQAPRSDLHLPHRLGTARESFGKIIRRSFNQSTSPAFSPTARS